MLQYIQELQEIDILVVCSCPLPPHVNDIRFTIGERNKKLLASPPHILVSPGVADGAYPTTS